MKKNKKTDLGKLILVIIVLFIIIGLIGYTIGSLF